MCAHCKTLEDYKAKKERRIKRAQSFLDLTLTLNISEDQMVAALIDQIVEDPDPNQLASLVLDLHVVALRQLRSLKEEKAIVM